MDCTENQARLKPSSETTIPTNSSSLDDGPQYSIVLKTHGTRNDNVVVDDDDQQSATRSTPHATLIRYENALFFTSRFSWNTKWDLTLLWSDSIRCDPTFVSQVGHVGMRACVDEVQLKWLHPFASALANVGCLYSELLSTCIGDMPGNGFRRRFYQAADFT